MVIDLADDSKNIFFKMDPKYLQTTAQYKLNLKSKYNNRWLFHAYEDTTGSQTQSGTHWQFRGPYSSWSRSVGWPSLAMTPYGIELTPVASGDTWVSFSWDADCVQNFFCYKLSEILDTTKDIDGYYIARLEVTQWPVTSLNKGGGDAYYTSLTYPIVETLCKVEADWSKLNTEYKPATQGNTNEYSVYIDKENQEEYTYYRDE
jgi:hypothetical protein